MMIHILGVFNNRIDAYGTPIFTREAVDDFVTQFVRSLKLANDDVKHNYEGCDLVHICDLNDLSGDVTEVKNLLLDLDKVLHADE